MTTVDPLQLGRVAGKRAIITGAGSGIGRAAAIRFATEGACVALVDINSDGLSEVESAIGGSGRTLAVVADVSNETQIDAAIRKAEAKFGGLDVVVANAAIHLSEHATRVHEFDLEAWKRTIAINLTGVFLTCKHAIPSLLLAGGGSIICTGSPTGLQGSAQLCAYSASKAAIMALVRVMAVEYAADGIRANSVVPGLTDTPFTQTLQEDAELRRAVVDRIPLGRGAEPEEIAAAMLFLASDESSYATGGMFIVDGGRTAS